MLTDELSQLFVTNNTSSPAPPPAPRTPSPPKTIQKRVQDVSSKSQLNLFSKEELIDFAVNDGVKSIYKTKKEIVELLWKYLQQNYESSSDSDSS